MEHLISQYIDDELTLDDKIIFVRAVHRDAGQRTAQPRLGQGCAHALILTSPTHARPCTWGRRPPR